MSAFAYSKTVNMTSVSIPALSNQITVLNTSAAGSLGVACGAELAHASLPAGTTILYYLNATTAVLSATSTNGTLQSAQTVVATNPDTINFDQVPALSSITTLKAGGDTYTMNGINLTIDQPTRYGCNAFVNSATATTTLGSMAPSAMLGGNILVDGRYVRLVPYNTGSGTLTHLYPVTITQAATGASGKVIGFYSSMTAAPVYTGAIPASGWLLIKAWNGTEFDASALTFTTGGGTAVAATATGASTVGLIEINGDDASSCTLSRRSTFTVRGKWFDVGTTDGNRTTLYQVPNNGLQLYLPAVWVQTATFTITGATWVDGIATFTTSATHTLLVGQQVTVEGVTPSAFNCVDQFISAVVDITDTTFSVAMDDPGSAYSSGGTAYAYESYPCVGNGLSAVLTTAGIQTDDLRRSKVFWNLNDASGLTLPKGKIAFGYDGTNSAGGYCPPSGRKIRIPNVIFNNNTAAARNQNSIPHATVATRYDFLTTGAGSIDIDGCLMNWYPSYLSSANTSIINAGIMSQLLIQEQPNLVTLKNICIGSELNNANYAPADFRYFYVGVDAHYCVFPTAVSSGAVGFTQSNLLFLTNAKFFDCVWWQIGLRTYTGRSAYFLVTPDLEVVRPRLIGMQLAISSAQGGLLKDFTYTDTTGIRAQTTQAMQALLISGFCQGLVVDGYRIEGYGGEPTSDGMRLNQPLVGPVRIRNIGTPTNPLNNADDPVWDKTWSRTTTAITVADATHTLVVNDYITVLTTNDTGQVIQGTKTVTAVTPGVSFTFTGLAGANSTGTLSYIRGGMNILINSGASASLEDVKYQRCYSKFERGAQMSSDNTSNHLTVESCWTEYTSGGLNGNYANNSASRISPLVYQQGSAAVYGTSWIDGAYLSIPETENATWVRSVTTVTLTYADKHNRWSTTSALYPIEIVTCSDPRALNIGFNEQLAATSGGSSPTTSTTMNVTGYNSSAGGTPDGSGSCTVRNQTGAVVLHMNEGTAENTCYTINAGNPVFTGAGSLAMNAVGDQITFESPYWIRGHVGFMNQTIAFSVGTAANYNIEYQIDKGAGWSGWKTLHRRTSNSCATTGTVGLTVGAADSWIQNGDYIRHTGYATSRGGYAVSGGGTTSLTLSQIHNTVASSLTCEVFALPSETGIDPDVGFKLRVRITTLIPNVEALNSLMIRTHMTAASRALTFPLDTATVSVNGLVTGSRIKATKVSDGSVLANIAESGGTASFETEYIGAIQIEARKASAAPYYQPWVTQLTTISGATVSATALQQLDE